MVAQVQDDVVLPLKHAGPVSGQTPHNARALMTKPVQGTAKYGPTLCVNVSTVTLAFFASSEKRTTFRRKGLLMYAPRRLFRLLVGK